MTVAGGEKTKWPVYACTHYPEIASKTSQIRNFGEQHYFVSHINSLFSLSSVLFTYMAFLVDVQTYEAELKIQHTIYNCNPLKFVDIEDPQTRQGMIIANIAFTMLIYDIKKLVQAGVLADIDS